MKRANQAINDFLDDLWHYCSGYLCKTKSPSLDEYDEKNTIPEVFISTKLDRDLEKKLKELKLL